MAAETFVGWAKRVTRSGEYDLSALIAFVESVEGHWRGELGKTTWNVPGWRKVAGRSRRKGLWSRAK